MRLANDDIDYCSRSPMPSGISMHYALSDDWRINYAHLRLGFYMPRAKILSFSNVAQFIDDKHSFWQWSDHHPFLFSSSVTQNLPYSDNFLFQLEH